MAQPHVSTEGLEGEDRRIELELKTVADVGLAPWILVEAILKKLAFGVYAM